MLNPPAAEFGRRRRKIYGRQKSAEKNSAGYNPAVKNNSTATRFFPVVEFYIVNSVQNDVYSYSKRQDGLRLQEM